MNEDKLKDLIRERIPGTSCRDIHRESETDMSLDEFRLLFNEVANEPQVEEDSGEESDDAIIH